MVTNKTFSAPRYLLGTATHLFTGLPTFCSGMEARDWALLQARNGVWFVYEERDVSRLGVCYGLVCEIVATVPAP